MINNSFILSLCLFTLFVWTPISRADDDEDDRRGAGVVFDSQIVRAADLGLTPPLGPSFPPIGADPLENGSLQARRNAEVTAQLEGARPNSSYRVFFCRYGLDSSACLELGSLNTDARGRGRVRLAFDTQPRIWAGIFVFTRDTPDRLVQYATGLRFSAPTNTLTGAEVELKGSISSRDLTNGSIRIEGFPVNIFVTSDTKFSGVEGFASLLLGLEVEVEGVTLTDGTIRALKIKAKRKDDD